MLKLDRDFSSLSTPAAHLLQMYRYSPEMAENIQACNQMFGSIVFLLLLFIERLQTLKSCVNAVQ